MLAFSIYDEKAKVFHQPFYFSQRGEAVRVISDTVSDPKTSLNRHPEDYKLYQIGSFDDNSGRLESLDVPELICNVSDFALVGK